MTPPGDLAAFADAGADALDLSLSAESRQAVIANLAILFARAAEFSEIPLEDGLDRAGLLRL